MIGSLRWSGSVLLAAGIFLSAPDTRALDLHVAPDGNDAWSGKSPRPDGTNGPLATLLGARDAIRRLKATGPMAEPVRVIVADGVYRVTEPLVLLPEDSGSQRAPISFQAAAGARPVFSGGRVIRGWTRNEGGVWQTQVPEVAAGRLYFEQLFVNGKRAVRARTPNKFYFHILDLLLEDLDAKRARQTVWLRPDDFRVVASLRPGEVKDVNLVVYHKWDVSRRFLDRLDTQEQALVLTGEGLKAHNPWQRNSPFILENFRSALDTPGEWFLDRDGTLSYLPLPDEEMATAEVIAPVAEKFIVIAGNPATNQFVEHVTFKGLAFRHAQWLTPPGGFDPLQAAATIDAVVMADGARHVTIEDCEIGHVGTYAVWFRRGCADNAIRRCWLQDLGAGGVRIGDLAVPAITAERTSRITVDNNIIQGGGRIFPCAVGVWVGQSPENRITHNDIADLFYTGISVGWSWGYGESLAKSNTIAFNRVHHLGQCLMSDMGGIYTLGKSEGTVVTNNVFHNIDAYSYGGWGLYADEGSSGILFENNFVYGTKTGGFHQHYGRENVVRNNILALGWFHQLEASRVESHRSFTFENNIVYWERGSLLAGFWDRVQHVTRSNCYWQTSGDPLDFQGRSLAEWQAAGHDQGSIHADPKFVDADLLDFRLFRDSAAVTRIGFKPFDYTQAGVYGEAQWIAKAKAVVVPPAELAPEPPMLIRQTFEREPAGKPPQGVTLRMGNRGDSILVTDEAAASGRQSLKISDAAGHTNTYDPHFYYQVTCGEGIVTNAFDLRAESGANIAFEWRDWSESKYRPAARFTIREGKLRLGDVDMLDVPVGQWVHFQVTAGIGTRSDGKWSLTVTLPGQAPREFNDLRISDANFKRLTWVGFTSNATNATAYYLDNFSLGVK